MGHTQGIIVYEDNADLRQTLADLIESESSLKLLGAFSNANKVLENMAQFMPDIVLMDIDMPGTNGLEALKKIKSVHPETDIIMLTVFEDNENIFSCIQAGASGYLLKRTPSNKLIEAIMEVKQGGAPMTPSVAKKVLQLIPKTPLEVSNNFLLSPREVQILTLLTKGRSYKMIAHDLAISLDTVRTYTKRMYKKLQVNSMTEAVSKAFRDGMV